MGIEINGAYVGAFNAVGFQQHKAGNYYASQIGASTTTATPTLNMWQAMPFWVPNAGAYDRIGAEITTNIATGVVRLGIVADDGTGNPGSLVLDAGTIDGSTTNAFKEITINQTLAAGLYWLTSCSQTAAPGMRLFNLGLPILGHTSTSVTGIIIGYQQASVTGALPASFTPSGTATSVPRVYIRRA